MWLGVLHYMDLKDTEKESICWSRYEAYVTVDRGLASVIVRNEITRSGPVRGLSLSEVAESVGSYRCLPGVSWRTCTS